MPASSGHKGEVLIPTTELQELQIVLEIQIEILRKLVVKLP